MAGRKKNETPAKAAAGSIVDLTNELWQAAVQLRGSGAIRLKQAEKAVGAAL